MKEKDSSKMQDKFKKLKNKYFWLFIGYQFFRIFCAYSQVMLLPLIRVMLVIVGIDLSMCEIIIKTFDLLLMNVPIVCFFMGIKMFFDDIKNMYDELILDEVNNFKTAREEQRRNDKLEVEYKEEDINRLITDFEKLPRREQMNVLNQLKEKRNLGTIKNVAVSDKLQNEFEDILFPDFKEEENKGKSRIKRR